MSITYHVCKYTPTEPLTALGGQCALLDEAPENFDLSDQVAHPNLCGFGKSVIQAALAGQVKELVLVNCCDTIRSAYDILKEFGNLDFLYLLDILHSQEGCSVQHARDQLLALAEAYGAYKGTQFDRRLSSPPSSPLPRHRAPHRRAGGQDGSHLFSLGGGDHAPAGGKRHLRQQPAGGPAGRTRGASPPSWRTTPAVCWASCPACA